MTMQSSNANPYSSRDQYIAALRGLVGDTGTILAVQNGNLTSIEKPMGRAAASSSLGAAASVVELKVMELLYRGRPWLETKDDFEKIVYEVVKKVGLKTNNPFTVNEHKELNTLIGLLYDEKVNNRKVEHFDYKKVYIDFAARFSKELSTEQSKSIRDAVKATFNTVMEAPKAAAESPVASERRTSERLKNNPLGVQSPISKGSPGKLRAIAQRVIENNSRQGERFTAVVDAAVEQYRNDQLQIEDKKQE